MRRITIALALAVGTLLMSIAGVDACGDKLLRIGRGARFQRSVHPASILIYVSASTPMAATSKVQSFLKRSGHKPRVVQGIDGFGGALDSGQQKQIDISSSKPLIVPIAIKATKAAVTAAKKQYRCLVKNPDDGEEYLDAIEAAMRLRGRMP